MTEDDITVNSTNIVKTMIDEARRTNNPYHMLHQAEVMGSAMGRVVSFNTL